MQTANIFVVEREAQFTVFAYGEVQSTGSSVQCSFLMDLAVGNELLTAVVNAPAYQGQAPAGTRGCLAPAEIGDFQALRNGVPEDLLENLTRVDYAISELSFGAEVPSQATPTVLSSESLFDSDGEPYVSGEARSTAETWTTICCSRASRAVRFGPDGSIAETNALPARSPTRHDDWFCAIRR